MNSLLTVLLMADPSGKSSPLMSLLPLVIIAIVVFIIITLIKNNKKKKLLKRKNDLIEKMSKLSDTGLINILEQHKNYQIEAIEVALSEANKRNLMFDYEKLKIEIKFSDTSKTISTKKSNNLIIIILIVIVLLILFYFAKSGLFGYEIQNNLR